MGRVQKIIDRLGGMAQMSRDLGHKNPTTVQGWRDRDRIPVDQIPSVLALAKTKRVRLSWDECLGINVKTAKATLG